MSTEVFFYHLEHRSLESVLPELLERTLSRGWRAVVHCGAPERVESLDLHLWTYADDSFLPHGTARDGAAECQPIYLTHLEENPNRAEVRFLTDGAEFPDLSGYVRAVFLFDGRNDDALQRARQQWKAIKTAGLVATYWQQSDGGKWEKKATSA
jgi:DNA polymerase III subunit chi